MDTKVLQPEVKVFIDVHVEERVKVDKVLVRISFQGVADHGAVQPLVQLRRPDGVVDDALESGIRLEGPTSKV